MMKMIKSEKDIEDATQNLMHRLENKNLDEDSRNSTLGALAGLCWVLNRKELVVPIRVRETLEGLNYS